MIKLGLNYNMPPLYMMFGIWQILYYTNNQETIHRNLSRKSDFIREYKHITVMFNAADSKIYLLHPIPEGQSTILPGNVNV